MRIHLKLILFVFAVLPALGSLKAQVIMYGSILADLKPKPLEHVPDSLQPRLWLRDPSQGLHTAASGSRILGSTYYEADATGNGATYALDSFSLTYSGGRGGDLYPDNPQHYDTFTTWKPLSGIWGVYSRLYQEFDTAGRLLLTTRASFGITIPTGRQLYTYNSQGLPATYMDTYWDVPTHSFRTNYQYSIAYSAEGLPITIISSYYDYNGVLYNINFDSFFYDASHHVTMHTIGSIDTLTGSRIITGGTAYNYTPAGLLADITDLDDQGAVIIYSNRYHYNSANELESFYYNDGENEDSTTVTGHTRDGLPLFTTLYVLYSYGNWHLQSMTDYTYNNLGLPLIETLLQPNSAEVGRKVNAYNSLGQLTLEDNLYPTGSFLCHCLPGAPTRYYYYDSVSTTAVNRIGVPLEFTISPVPADDKLAVQLSSGSPQQITAIIYNTSGQEVAAQRPGAARAQTISFPTASLAPGTYILSIFSSDGNRQSKVFTVQH